MTCRKVQFLIQSYVDGAAARPEREAVDAHVVRCPECARALAGSRQLVSLLASAGKQEVSDAFDRRLTAAIRKTEPASPRAASWERLRLQLEWRLRVPAMVTSAGLAAAVIAALVIPQLRDGRVARVERGQYVATAVQRHQQIEESADTNWDALDASIQLSTGASITE